MNAQIETAVVRTVELVREKELETVNAGVRLAFRELGIDANNYAAWDAVKVAAARRLGWC